jgi:Fur family peroxide stress response transcriptional regulator
METLNKLRDKNLKVTPQRVAILDFLDKKTHPTIDEIYGSVKKSFISISLATIYKNLNTLKENGIVVEINTKSGKIKYDLNIKSHIHSYCPKCQKIEDIFLDDTLNEFNQKVSILLNRDILQSDILLTIVCENCCEDICD